MDLKGISFEGVDLVYLPKMWSSYRLCENDIEPLGFLKVPNFFDSVSAF